MSLASPGPLQGALISRDRALQLLQSLSTALKGVTIAPIRRLEITNLTDLLRLEITSWDPGRTELHALTTTVASLAATVERLIVDVATNRYAPLPLDTDGPPPPASSYAAAAARPAVPRTPAPRPAAREPARRESERELVIIRTSPLPSDDALRALAPARLPAYVRNKVSYALDSRAVITAERLEKGDVRVVLRDPSSAALFRRIVPSAFPPAETSTPVERCAVYLRDVPVAMPDEAVVARVEEVVREKGVVRTAKGMAVGEGWRFRTVRVELWNTRAVSDLVSLAAFEVKWEGAASLASVERARSAAEQRERRERREVYLQRHAPPPPPRPKTPPPPPADLPAPPALPRHSTPARADAPP
ncbi:hypothetical protein JCM10207_006421, partial [Rhodosporidiobolus poonsookiae]